MDPKQLKTILIPTTALAAVILVAAIIISGGGGNSKTAGSGAKGDPDRPIIPPPGADTSADGMALERPNPDAIEWRTQKGGLKIWDVKEGTGEPVAYGDTVLAHYTGWFTNGNVFDSSVKRGEAMQFSLRKVVLGWQDGIPGMKPGGIRRLYVPWAMAYGEQGGSGIPPKSDLIFEVKLIAFQGP